MVSKFSGLAARLIEEKEGKGGGGHWLYGLGKGMAIMSLNRADLGERISGRSKEGRTADVITCHHFFSFIISVKSTC